MKKNNKELMKYDEAIKILKKVEVFDIEAGDLLENHSDIVRDALNFAIKELEDHRWIPVTKRLPKKEGEYLVTFRYENGDKYVTEWYWTKKDGFPLKVVAWMNAKSYEC